MTASVWSAIFAGGALVAAVTLGVLNLRQARRGPDVPPCWQLEATGAERQGVGWWSLTNNGGTALDVRVDYPDVLADDGTNSRQVRDPIPRFAKGESIVFVPLPKWGRVQRVRVRFRDEAGSERPEWIKEITL